MCYYNNGPLDKIDANKTLMMKNISTTSDNTIISKSTLTSATIEDFSPYLRFSYALNAPESKRQYPKRFKVFLDYLGIDIENNSSIEERINKFYYDYIIKKGNKWLENELCKFFILQNERAERNEISTQTIPNYYKPIKLFCDMNGISITWKLITKGIKKGQRHSDDRPPSIEEIKKLLEYPDRRIKVIVLVMISSGIRISSWNYIKLKHFTPLERNCEMVAAKIDAFNTKTKKYYYTFCTVEAYLAVKEWMDFRASFGEKITGESDVLRDLWQIKGQRYANYVGLARHPKKFGYHGIRMLINDAWKIQGVREELTEGKRRYEFKSLHGFRKFFETECQKVMKSLYVSFLMSHDTGIVQHYHKPKLDELLDNYLLAVDFLTISETNKLYKKIIELQQQDDYQKYVIDKKILTNQFEDYRKIIVNLILAPYLIVIKKLSFEESFQIINEWLKKCSLRRELDFNSKSLINTALATAHKKQIPPMRITTLKTNHKDLYFLIEQKEGKREG